MIYGLSCVICILFAYIIFLHLRIREVAELVKESNILSANENVRDNKTYYLKFDTDKYGNVLYVNDDMIKYCGFDKDNILGKNVLGTIFDNTQSNQSMLAEYWKQFRKKRKTISTEHTILKANGEKVLVLLRARPILNELLACKNISFWGYPLNKKLDLELELKRKQNKDLVVGNILNADGFIQKLDEQVKICNRYNRSLLLIVVELKDVYNFVSKGFDYNVSDKLLCLSADACIENVGAVATIGRFDYTKIGIMISNSNEDYMDKIKCIRESIVDKIRKLNVDKVNAEMLDIFYTRRRNIKDTSDNMLARSRKYLKNSMDIHRYGIGTIDKLN